MRKILFVFMILILFVLVNFYKSPISNYANAQAEEESEPQVFDFSKIDVNELIAKQIEEDNIRYKDRVFGNVSTGLAMSIEPIKDEYNIDDEIEISILVKNFSQENLSVFGHRGVDMKDYRYALYYSDGKLVHCPC